MSDALAKGKIAATLEATQRAASLQEIYRFAGAYTMSDLQDLTTIAAEHVGDVIQSRIAKDSSDLRGLFRSHVQGREFKCRPCNEDLIKSAAETWLVDEATALKWIIEIADERSVTNATS